MDFHAFWISSRILLAQKGPARYQLTLRADGRLMDAKKRSLISATIVNLQWRSKYFSAVAKHLTLKSGYLASILLNASFSTNMHISFRFTFESFHPPCAVLHVPSSASSLPSKPVQLTQLQFPLKAWLKCYRWSPDSRNAARKAIMNNSLVVNDTTLSSDTSGEENR